MNKKRIAVILGIIVIIVIIILLSIRLITIKNEDTTAFNEDNTIQNEIDNNVTVENEVNNEIENNVEENTDNNQQVDESQNTPPADDKQEVSKETIEKEQSNEEKAISIVKQDWGEDDKVYFSYEGITNGKYKVGVRETASTRAITYYLVNVDNGTFEIQD